MDAWTVVDRAAPLARLKALLTEFDAHQHDPAYKRGIYVCGASGTGKSHAVRAAIAATQYDAVWYTAGDVRNPAAIEALAKSQVGRCSIEALLHGRTARRLAIVMDDVDCMLNGDKGGVNALIRLIRPKKTKKQRQEPSTLNPVVCIGNARADKKIKELMKVCHVIDWPSLTCSETEALAAALFPAAWSTRAAAYSRGDVRVLYRLRRWHERTDAEALLALLQTAPTYRTAKDVTAALLAEPHALAEHNVMMNDTDRTSVGLLWHENVVDELDRWPVSKERAVALYLEQLDHLCVADYVDRVTFQKQIWQFNEMSSLIKTFCNQHVFHEHKRALESATTTAVAKRRRTSQDIRFTKVLTKYSTEYNNTLFLQKMCHRLAMDKKDLIAFFHASTTRTADPAWVAAMDQHEISKLDVQRMYRYMDKFVHADATTVDDCVIDSFDVPADADADPDADE